MKLQEYREEFLFDEFPKVFNPTQKVIFTHSHDWEKLQLPSKVPTIFTTTTLAKRLKHRFNTKNKKVLFKKNFCFLKPNKAFRLILSDEKKIKLIAFEENTPSRSLMILLHKDGKVTHFYAGACTHIRHIVLSDMFACSLRHGVDRLYMYLTRADVEAKHCEEDEIVEKIESLLKNKNAYIKLIVPRFGCENLLALLAFNYRALVHLTPALWKLYSCVLESAHFQEDSENARIFVTHNDAKYIKSSSEEREMIELKVVNTATQENTNEMSYSAFPKMFDLKLLAGLVRPGQIFGIAQRHMNPPKLPSYLRAMCRIPPRINAQKSAITQPAVPLTKIDISPTKSTPAIYCIRKPNLEYMDNDDTESTT